MKDDSHINNLSVRLFIVALFGVCFTQIYRALYEDAMSVPIQMGTEHPHFVIRLFPSAIRFSVYRDPICPISFALLYCSLYRLGAHTNA